MMKSGWCLVGQHETHPDNPCPKRFQKFVHVPAKRNKPAHIEYLDEYNECDCSCHGKQTAKTRKKRK